MQKPFSQLSKSEMFFCIGIKVMLVKDPRAFLPTSEYVS